MPYILLAVVFAVWAFIVLRDRPVAYYLGLFFFCFGLTVIAEPFTSQLLDLYDWRLWLLNNPHDDILAGTLVIGLFLDPIIGVLYARYATAPHPVLRALAATAVLVCLEVYLQRTGYMIYYGWLVVFTAIAFYIYLGIVWWVVNKFGPIPDWLHTYGAATWLLTLVDISLQGILELWTYNLEGFNARRLFSICLQLFLIAPVLTVVARKGRWSWAAAGIGGLLTLEILAWYAGLILFRAWHPLLSAAVFAIEAWAINRYSLWLSSTTEQEGVST